MGLKVQPRVATVAQRRASRLCCAVARGWEFGVFHKESSSCPGGIRTCYVLSGKCQMQRNKLRSHWGIKQYL